MKQDQFDDQFDTALSGLTDEAADLDLSGFEHGVWSEIAIRDGDTPSRSGWFPSGFSLPAPAMAACAVLAILLGSVFGLSRAQAYSKEASLEVEKRYIESIHPVMMSADHTGHSH